MFFTIDKCENPGIKVAFSTRHLGPNHWGIVGLRYLEENLVRAVAANSSICSESRGIFANANSGFRPVAIGLTKALPLIICTAICVATGSLLHSCAKLLRRKKSCFSPSTNVKILV